MKAASVKEIKQELSTRSTKELLDLCLRLSRFKKENKELLTYLLFEEEDEEAYVLSIKRDIDDQFESMNTTRYYLIKKSIRKILSGIKKYIRYSTSKETEVELLLYFCQKLRVMRPSYKRNKILSNHYNRQFDMAKKRITMLHEDLQFDYQDRLEELSN